MKHRVVRRPAADRDIIEHAYFIGRRSLDASDRFLRAVEDTIAMISEHPGLGRDREWHHARLWGIRQWRVRGFTRHLIFYRLIQDTVEIVRVVHGSRDLEAALLEEDF